ncbi:MAG: prenyltransferase [Candidatus Bathyarchaeota archaeon]
MVDLRLLKVVRPHIVAGGFLGYLVGVLFSLNLGGRVSWTGFALGYLVVLFMDLSTHYNNDYYDVEIDRRAPFKPFGSVNLFIEHPELRDSAFLVAVGFSVLSLLCASAMVLMGSMWHLLVVVLLFNVLGWLYSAPPVRLHSRRLGEVTIAVGTGFCVPAVGYIVASGAVDGAFLLFSAPLVLYGFVLSLCLQMPDLESDQALGKRTLVGLIGRRYSYMLVLVSSVAASVSFFYLVPDVTGVSWLLPSISLVPVASSLACVLLLNASHSHARLFTRVNVSSLFVLLAGLNIALLLGLA